MSSTLVESVERVAPTPPRCRVAHAWLTAELYALLEREAHRRGTSPDVMCAQLTEHMLLKLTPRAAR